MSDPRKPIFDQIRAARGTGFTAQEVGRIDAFLTAIGVPTLIVAPVSHEPLWTHYGRTKIGEREIPGAQNSPWIMSFWKGTIWEGVLKSDDSDSPWCGGFQKWCMQQAGVEFPREFPRAKAWSTWGTATRPAVGAIGVKSRQGGGHVFQIIGITPDGRNYKVLEGNANNMVRIGDIPVSVVDAVRWPPNQPLPTNFTLPVLPAGVISTSEG